MSARTPTTPPVIVPLTHAELDDVRDALAESPSLDGQRWFGVWTPTVEGLYDTVRALQQGLRKALDWYDGEAFYPPAGWDEVTALLPFETDE